MKKMMFLKIMYCASYGDIISYVFDCFNYLVNFCSIMSLSLKITQLPVLIESKFSLYTLFKRKIKHCLHSV